MMIIITVYITELDNMIKLSVSVFREKTDVGLLTEDKGERIFRAEFVRTLKRHA